MKQIFTAVGNFVSNASQAFASAPARVVRNVQVAGLNRSIEALDAPEGTVYDHLSDDQRAEVRAQKVARLEKLRP